MARQGKSANDNSRPGTYVPAPLNLPGFPEAQRARGKTPIPGGGLRQRWKDGRGTIFEWDYRHGRVEVYDRRGGTWEGSIGIPA